LITGNAADRAFSSNARRPKTVANDNLILLKGQNVPEMEH